MKLTKPIKGMTERNISQIYHEGHKGWDVVSFSKYNGYGTPLCAPERMRIKKIVGDTYSPDSIGNLKRGYGVWGVGLETGYTYVFWHTLPYLPVWGGDTAERGSIIAYMGNAGYVYSNSVYVPLEERSKEPFKGTHLHMQIYEKGHPTEFIKGGELDPMTLIDLSLEPRYGVLDQLVAMGTVVKKIAKGIKP